MKTASTPWCPLGALRQALRKARPAAPREGSQTRRQSAKRNVAVSQWRREVQASSFKGVKRPNDSVHVCRDDLETPHNREFRRRSGASQVSDEGVVEPYGTYPSGSPRTSISGPSLENVMPSA